MFPGEHCGCEAGDGGVVENGHSEEEENAVKVV